MNQKIQIEKLGKERQRLTEKIKKIAEKKNSILELANKKDEQY